MAPTLVRVLVLDASPTRRLRLQRLLETDPALQGIGSVTNAERAIETAARRQADVIVVGLGSALQETVAAIRAIMQARATPVVVVAGAAAPLDGAHAFALMEAGALAVVHDPGAAGAVQQEAAAQKLLETVRLMSEVKVVRRWASLAAAHPALPAPRRAVPQPAARAPERVPRPARSPVEVVAIGASTGGPVALRQVLCPLPAAFPVPILIVQHMADGFLDGLAAWLSASCAVPTEIAGPGTALQAGRAYLAPDGAHMRVNADGELVFDARAPVNGHRPAVSCLFASVARHYGAAAIGILLTGMGKDGAAELKEMKEAGAVTIAQDEASCVVHGMPGEAIRCGGATYVMSPDEIGAALPALVQR